MLKKITIALIALFTATSANAGMLSNQDRHLETLRGSISQQLHTPALIQAMQAQGISQGEAQARIQRLSYSELNNLAEHIDNAPAGGSFVTFIIIGFAIVAVTDSLGYTDLFPFIKGPE